MTVMLYSICPRVQFVEGYTLDDACPKTLLSSASLWKLTVSLEQNVAVDKVLGAEQIIHSNDPFWSFNVGSFKLTSSEFEDTLIFLFSCRVLYIYKGVCYSTLVL